MAKARKYEKPIDFQYKLNITMGDVEQLKNIVQELKELVYSPEISIPNETGIIVLKLTDWCIARAREIKALSVLTEAQSGRILKLQEDFNALATTHNALLERLDEETNDRENLEIRFDEMHEQCGQTIKSRTSQLYEQRSQLVNIRHRLECLENPQ